MLGSWCLSYAALMARPLQLLLAAGGKLSQTVLDCAGAVAYIASGRFLCASRGSREPVSRILLLLAERGCLDLLQKCQRWDWLNSADDVWQILTEDSLMPLTQLPAFRQELRQLRFCSPALAEALEPFPRLLDDLLDAWFGEEGEQGEVSMSLAGLELVSWAERCARFRQNFLRAQLRELTPQSLRKLLQNRTFGPGGDRLPGAAAPSSKLEVSLRSSSPAHAKSRRCSQLRRI